MKILFRDNLCEELLKEVDVTAIIKKYFPSYIPNENVKCPFHPDTKASLHIDMQGRAKCHGCGIYASNLIDLVSKLEGISYLQARKLLGSHLLNGIPEEVVDKYATFLWRNKKALSYLMEDRCLSEEVIRNFKLGYSPSHGRITIPIFDTLGVCRNIKYAAIERPVQNKYLNHSDDTGFKYGSPRLYPEWLLYSFDRLVLVEGEFDALVGWSNKLPTFTFTSGAASWRHEWSSLLKGKSILILMDNDTAGLNAAEFIGNSLRTAGAVVKIVNHFPKKGKDLTDYAHLSSWKEWLRRWKKELGNLPLPSPSQQTVLCPKCGRPL
ncbi:MAG: toprim domain-containing protein [Candidatus Methanomethylicaceae archaeon]